MSEPVPDYRVARPIEYAPKLPPRFPYSSLSRRDAIVDILIIAGVLAGFALYTELSDLHVRLHERFPSGGMYVWVVMNGALAMFSIAVLLNARRLGPGSLGLNRIALSKLILCVLIAVPGAYLVGAVGSITTILLSRTNFMQLAHERTSFLAAISDIPLHWILPVMLFVGLYEEVVFRGFLLPRLFAILPGRAFPIAIGALIFGALHFTQGMPFMVQITFVAVALSVLAVVTRSLWPSILTHASVDTLSILIAIKFAPWAEELLKSATSAPTTMP